MSSNQDIVRKFYQDGKEENRYQASRSVGMEFHYVKKFMGEYIKPDSDIIELGCGAGYYGMHFADQCANYIGVDMSPDNIERFRSHIEKAGVKNVTALKGDAMDLSDIKKGSFDVVMCLGPMYHLQHRERLKVFKECYRVAKKGGIISFAYINRLGVYAGACVLESKYPNAEANKLVFEQNTGDIDPGLFIFTSPEEMESDAKKAGYQIIKNHGLDFMFESSAIDAMSEEQFKHYMEISDRMSESASCVGLSNHALLICKK